MAKRDLFGVKPRISKGGVVMFLKDSKLYSDLHKLTKKERAVLDLLIKDMCQGLNTIIVSGEYRDELLNSLSITTGSLSTILSNLKKREFIDKTLLANEYVVSPLLAYKPFDREVQFSSEMSAIGNTYYLHSVLENELRVKT